MLLFSFIHGHSPEEHCKPERQRIRGQHIQHEIVSLQKTGKKHLLVCPPARTDDAPMPLHLHLPLPHRTRPRSPESSAAAFSNPAGAQPRRHAKMWAYFLPPRRPPGPLQHLHPPLRHPPPAHPTVQKQLPTPSSPPCSPFASSNLSPSTSTCSFTSPKCAPTSRAALGNLCPHCGYDLPPPPPLVAPNAAPRSLPHERTLKPADSVSAEPSATSTSSAPKSNATLRCLCNPPRSRFARKPPRSNDLRVAWEKTFDTKARRTPKRLDRGRAPW